MDAVAAVPSDGRVSTALFPMTLLAVVPNISHVLCRVHDPQDRFATASTPCDGIDFRTVPITPTGRWSPPTRDLFRCSFHPWETTITITTRSQEEKNMNKVLVAHASRMGSTAEIAEAVAAELRAAGFDVDVFPCDRAPDAVHYDAVVLGSAVYSSRWQKSALNYLAAQAPDLAERPTWLFQSGPCGEDSEHATIKTPHHVHKLAFQIGVCVPTTFEGRLDHELATGPLTRWMTTGALSGDYRDWNVIHTWARGIAETLLADGDSLTAEWGGRLPATV